MDQILDLELAGMGSEAWDLSYAQVQAFHAKLMSERAEQDLRRHGAALAANPKSKEAGEFARQWLALRTR
ncbi:hypothetical protein [Bosea sp. (in: a-proteobacteria)]|uniref:hypothetical protein n=1 Tax=Bosea sp. (in: a-proteobacteria) TaxID=1871050 RepID=UPI00273339EA|nr:hypothetical protein [Bosea sp. (in: a-proteobacteria)]MDP3408072.1 hypothetical protein [Bosea sp. (in: a-proteobacteria)]